jgi:glycerate-2-kinase
MEKEKAVQIFLAATAAVQPAQLLQQHLSADSNSLVIGGQHIPKQSFNHIYVIGAGKAAAAMAVETEKIIGDYIIDGLVTTKYGHSLPAQKITIREAAHPVPDEKGVEAVAQTVQLLEKVTREDIVICLISGGASALWCDLPPGITLPEVQATVDLLLRSGADIRETNTVRKHLSAIKGGQLLRHCNGARVFSLIISDVPGDDLSVIASGPTVADASTFREAYDILSKYELLPALPPSIRGCLEKGIQGSIAETPKPGDPLFGNTVNRIIGNNGLALRAAAAKARELGYHTYILPQLITGDATAAAKAFVAGALAYNGNKPVCILQGGETTVKVTGQGKGGRNQHFVLAALNELNKLSGEKGNGNIIILSGGTDGTDGPTDAAGAVIDSNTLARAARQHLDIEAWLKDHDSYHFFRQTDSLLITGPTQTNVMDIMMALVQ